MVTISKEAKRQLKELGIKQFRSFSEDDENFAPIEETADKIQEWGEKQFKKTVALARKSSNGYVYKHGHYEEDEQDLAEEEAEKICQILFENNILTIATGNNEFTVFFFYEAVE